MHARASTILTLSVSGVFAASVAIGYQDPPAISRRTRFVLRSFVVARSIAPGQARRESNPQPAVLETAALPIELLAFSAVSQRPSAVSKLVTTLFDDLGHHAG